MKQREAEGGRWWLESCFPPPGGLAARRTRWREAAFPRAAPGHRAAPAARPGRPSSRDGSAEPISSEVAGCALTWCLFFLSVGENGSRAWKCQRGDVSVVIAASVPSEEAGLIPGKVLSTVSLTDFCVFFFF